METRAASLKQWLSRRPKGGEVRLHPLVGEALDTAIDAWPLPEPEQLDPFVQSILDLAAVQADGAGKPVRFALVLWEGERAAYQTTFGAAPSRPAGRLDAVKAAPDARGLVEQAQSFAMFAIEAGANERDQTKEAFFEVTNAWKGLGGFMEARCRSLEALVHTQQITIKEQAGEIARLQGIHAPTELARIEAEADAEVSSNIWRQVIRETSRHFGPGAAELVFQNLPKLLPMLAGGAPETPPPPPPEDPKPSKRANGAR